MSGTISSYTISNTSTVTTLVPAAMATVVNYGKIFAPLYQERHSYGTGGTAIQFNGGGLITNALGGTINGGTGIGASNVTATVVNAGSIGGTATIIGPNVWYGTAFGVSLGAGGLVTNVTSGEIQGYHAGVYIAGGAATVVNAGEIGGQGLYSTGVQIRAGGLIDNRAGGVISAGSLDAIEVGAGIEAVFSPAIVINAGSILSQQDFPRTNHGAGVRLDAGGSVTNIAGGLIAGSYGLVTTGEAAAIVNAGSISGLGIGVDLGHGGSVTNQSGGTISAYPGPSQEAVKFEAGYVSRLVVDPGAVFIGSLDGGNTIGSTAVSTLELAAEPSSNGSLYALGVQFTNFGSIAFDPGANWFIAGDTSSLAGTIGGFALGDTIEVTGIAVTGSSYAGGILTLNEASGSTTLNFSTDLEASHFLVTNVSGGADISVECFCIGTRILTSRGKVAVEDLRLGDRVDTVTGGEGAPITWIGRRTIDCTRHPKPERVWPVRVGAGAFADGLPCRDLFLSPNHAIYVNEVLIPVKHLINGSSIAQVPMDQVIYYHVELAQHDVLFAEGLPAETYLDTGDRSNFYNSSETIQLFPDFSAYVCGAALFWDAYGFAPLVVTGAPVEAVRRQVNTRAAAVDKQAAA